MIKLKMNHISCDRYGKGRLEQELRTLFGVHLEAEVMLIILLIDIS